MSSQHDQPGTILRQRMIEDMSLRNFSEKARTDYIRHVRTFAAFLSRPPKRASPVALTGCLHITYINGCGNDEAIGLPITRLDRRLLVGHLLRDDCRAARLD